MDYMCQSIDLKRGCSALLILRAVELSSPCAIHTLTLFSVRHVSRVKCTEILIVTVPDLCSLRRSTVMTVVPRFRNTRNPVMYILYIL